MSGAAKTGSDDLGRFWNHSWTPFGRGRTNRRSPRNISKLAWDQRVGDVTRVEKVLKLAMRLRYQDFLHLIKAFGPEFPEPKPDGQGNQLPIGALSNPPEMRFCWNSR
ncbi:MAG: hypothetical protein ACWA49_10530 [Ruegeria sp.]